MSRSESAPPSSETVEPTERVTHRGVCVVTHPLSAAGENATRGLLEILAAITSVSLVTADLPADSVIRDRHDVTEITHDGTGETVLTAAVRFVRNQLRMCREIARRDEEIVLFFGATAYLLPVLFARLVGRTVVIEPRGDVPLTLELNWRTRMPAPVAALLVEPLRLLEDVNYWLADAVVTYTPGMAVQLGLDRFSEKLYPHGARYVQTDVFRPTTPYEERENCVGFLGRIDEEKGIEKLAHVARQLPAETTFVFAGSGDLSDWLADELADEIATGHVELTGWVDHEDVPSLLSRFELLVMPSSPTEGLPTTILEALACGTPVYATPVSGVPDVVHEGKTGFLMGDTDPRSIATSVERILERDDLAAVSRNGRNLVEEEYSFEAAVARYRELLATI